MDYNHLISVHDETNFDELNLDLPFAIFMMKLLLFKLDFRKMSSKSYEEYIKSDNPIKLRYYIQTKLKEEISKCFNEAKEENNNQKNELHKLFYSGEEHPIVKRYNEYQQNKQRLPDNLLLYNFKCNKKPSYQIMNLKKEDKKKLYDKYLKDYIPDEETKELSKQYLDYWISTENIKDEDQKIYEIIDNIINNKININHSNIMNRLINQLNKINTRQSIYDLLESINDVNRAGLY